MLRWELLAICWLSALAIELLVALELLFIIRPHGAVEFLKMRCCFVAEMLLFMELLCCKWCALLVICWLSALALELLFELLFMELLFIIRPGAAGAPDHSAAVYHSPSSCCLWSCCL